MFTIHLLGHVYISCRNAPVRLSLKALGLITYLALEGTPQHRERLAELLWPSSDAHKNLRVELARIRAAGLDVFPRSSKILYLDGFSTDLGLWRDQTLPQTAEELTVWLSSLRGLPLSGLEDIGDAAMQDWVEQQRFHLQSQVEQHLSHVHALYRQAGMPWATQLIGNRAAATGYELHNVSPAAGELTRITPPSALAMTGTPDLTLLNPCGAAFDQALQAALPGQPVTILVYGPLGMGKTHLVRQGLKLRAWLELYAPSSRTGRLVIASLAQQLLPHASDSGRETLRDLLQRPGSLEEDVIKLSVVLGDAEQAVGIVLDHAHTADVELASLMEFLMHSPAGAPRALIVSSRQPPEHVKFSRALLRRFPAGQCHQIAMMPLSVAEVERIVQEQEGAPAPIPGTPGLNAARLLQLSEGNPLHLLGHLERLRQGERPSHAAGRWTQLVRERYLGEVDGWTPEFRAALQRLSVMNGAFTLPDAAALLGSTLSAAEETVRRAVQQGVLVQEVRGVPLQLPHLAPLAGTPGQVRQYQFRFEGLRVVLAGLVEDHERASIRERLITHLRDVQPGLALYYAERAGQAELVEELRDVYEQRLPTVRSVTPPASRHLPASNRVGLPPNRVGPGVPMRVWDGYLISWSEHGWLSIVSQGRSGLPGTLTLHLPLSALPAGKQPAKRAAQAGSLRLVWRLDVYNPGLQFNPLKVPFALRVEHSDRDVASVFAPEVTGAYSEDGILHQAMPDVTIGEWMEHHLPLPHTADDAFLYLSVRAMDVSLTIGALEIQGQDVLSAQLHNDLPVVPVRKKTSS